jgi:hypothetical protein
MSRDSPLRATLEFIDHVTAKAKPKPEGGGGGGAIAKKELGGTVQPIGSLNPYQNRWAIKARIATSNGRKGARSRGSA